MKPSCNPFATRLLRHLLLSGSTALAISFTQAATFVFTGTTGTSPWSAGTDWDTAPASDPSTILTFGNATQLAADAIVLSENDLSGDFVLNALNATYEGPATGTAPAVSIAGNRLLFVSDASTPTLTFNTTGTVKPVVTISNEISLGNAVTVTATTNAQFSGLISGTGNLTKSGTGTLTLSNSNNSYTGNTSITAGLLDVGAIGNNSLGVGGLLFNGGVLQGNGTFTRNFNNGGLVAAANNEIAGATGGFSARGGPLSINFGGASAQVTLSGPGNRLGTGFTLGSAAANNKVTVVNPMALNGAIRTFTVPTGAGGDSAELSGILSGSTAAGVNKTGTGYLTLSGSNTYGGATTVNAGVLVITHGNALGTAAASATSTTTVASTASLQAANGIVANANEALTIAGTGGTVTNAGALHAGTGGATWAGPISLGASARIGATPGNTLIVTGPIGNGTNSTLSISGQGGTGVVVLNPATPSSYTGQTILVRGILRLGKDNALPITTVIDAKDPLNSTDAVSLDLAGYHQEIAGLFDSGANANNIITNSAPSTNSILTINNATTYTYDGTIENGAGTVSLIKNGLGTQLLSNSHSYSGATTINLGILSITHANALGDTIGNTTIAATGTTIGASAGGRLLLSNNITCPENITLTGSSEANSFSASIDSVSGNNTLTGTISLAGTGGQRINATGALSLNGAISRSGTNAGALVLRPATISSTIQVNDEIDLNGSSLNVQGLGTVQVNTPSTDFTSISVAFGGADLALKLGASNVLPTSANLTIGTNNILAGSDQGKFDLAGYNQTFKGVTAIRSNGGSPTEATQRRITNSSDTLSTLTAGNNTLASDISTFDGTIEDGSGGVALVKTGAGTLTLAAANTYTGNTNINGGTLRITGSTAAGSTVSIGAAGTLTGSGTVSGAVSSSGTISPGVNGVGTLTTGALNLSGILAIDVSGSISDKITSSGAIQLSGPLTLTLLGNGFTEASYVIAEGSSLSGSFSSVPDGYTVSYNGTQAILRTASAIAPYSGWIDTFASEIPDPADRLPGADPDEDGSSNLIEFALHGDPSNAADSGLIASLIQDSSDPAGRELTLIIAARDGATFNQATATVDDITYTVEGSLSMAFPGSAVSHTGPSDTAPTASGLPSLGGTDWEYHTFKLDASEGLTGKGFLRLKVSQP